MAAPTTKKGCRFHPLRFWLVGKNRSPSRCQEDEQKTETKPRRKTALKTDQEIAKQNRQKNTREKKIFFAKKPISKTRRYNCFFFSTNKATFAVCKSFLTRDIITNHNINNNIMSNNVLDIFGSTKTAASKSSEKSIFGDVLPFNHFPQPFEGLNSKQIDKQFDNDLKIMVKALSKMPAAERKAFISLLAVVLELYVTTKVEQEIEESIEKILKF